jgi:hypothetical protein
MLISPYQPAGRNLSQKVAVGTASTPLAMTALSQSANACQYWVENVGVNWIYWEAAGNAAATGQAAPTASLTTSPGIPPNSVVLITAPPAAQFAFISAATGNTVGVTPGEGI